MENIFFTQLMSEKIYILWEGLYIQLKNYGYVLRREVIEFKFGLMPKYGFGRSTRCSGSVWGSWRSIRAYFNQFAIVFAEVLNADYSSRTAVFHTKIRPSLWILYQTQRKIPHTIFVFISLITYCYITMPDHSHNNNLRGLNRLYYYVFSRELIK